MVTKINVSLSQELLKSLDQAAKESHISRSAFLAEAVKHYLQEQEEAGARERRRKAAQRIDQIREELGDWDATGEVLKWRQLH